MTVSSEHAWKFSPALSFLLQVSFDVDSWDTLVNVRSKCRTNNIFGQDVLDRLANGHAADDRLEKPAKGFWDRLANAQPNGGTRSISSCVYSKNLLEKSAAEGGFFGGNSAHADRLSNFVRRKDNALFSRTSSKLQEAVDCPSIEGIGQLSIHFYIAQRLSREKTARGFCGFLKYSES